MARTCVSKDAQSRCKGPSPPRSVALEAALQFPVGDPTIVLELLPAGSVQVMLHDLVAKGRAQHLRLLQRLDRPAQGLRHVVQLLAAVRVAEVGLRPLQLLLDAGQACRPKRREGGPAVQVATADAPPEAHPLRLAPARAD